MSTISLWQSVFVSVRLRECEISARQRYLPTEMDVWRVTNGHIYIPRAADFLVSWSRLDHYGYGELQRVARVEDPVLNASHFHEQTESNNKMLSSPMKVLSPPAEDNAANQSQSILSLPYELREHCVIYFEEGLCRSLIFKLYVPH